MRVVGVLWMFRMVGVFRMFGMVGARRALARRRLGWRFGFRQDPPAGGDLRGLVSLAQLTERVDFIVSIHTKLLRREAEPLEGVFAVSDVDSLATPRQTDPRLALMRNMANAQAEVKQPMSAGNLT